MPAPAPAGNPAGEIPWKLRPERSVRHLCSELMHGDEQSVKEAMSIVSSHKDELTTKLCNYILDVCAREGKYQVRNRLSL